jgi:hypothetical protein
MAKCQTMDGLTLISTGDNFFKKFFHVWLLESRRKRASGFLFR